MKKGRREGKNFSEGMNTGMQEFRKEYSNAGRKE
jgi:hypothetical protein